MFNFTKSSHNILGMVILFLLLIVIVGILVRLLRKNPFSESSKLMSLTGLILVHLQIIVGIILYFISPYGYSNLSGEAMKQTISRFYALEHPVGMILAAILITIGYRRAKDESRTDRNRHLQVLLFYGIGFVIISYLIPWFLWS